MIKRRLLRVVGFSLLAVILWGRVLVGWMVEPARDPTLGERIQAAYDCERAASNVNVHLSDYQLHELRLACNRLLGASP